MKELKWEKTGQRFVAFFDILGFKDMVERFSHDEVLQKLDALKAVVQNMETIEVNDVEADIKIQKDQSRGVTFSDSFIFFSNGNTRNDALKIIADAYNLVRGSLEAGIAIKGVISYGEITVDFEKSIFFGQPIIDAYLLHEDLQQLSVIVDHHAENQIRTFSNQTEVKRVTTIYDVSMKYGRVKHTILRPSNPIQIPEYISLVSELYKGVSGKPRMYLDNTMTFFRSLKVK